MPMPKKNCSFSKCCFGTFCYISILIFLLFITVFVIIPVAFKYSTEIQRGIVFPTWYVKEKDYSNVDKYGLPGTRNLYVKVNPADNITLGVYQIIPEELANPSLQNDQYNYEAILKNKNYKIVLYLHGNGQDRAGSSEMYKVLRKSFDVLAVDYRGYGDSSKGEMIESKVVQDIVDLYKWIRQQTQAPIYIWGHSLGTGVGTHVTANLKAQNIVPSGLILEAPFTSVTDVIQAHSVSQAFSWLPWYRATFIDPIIDNGFNFDTKSYITNVDCPIMILHAKDDDIIPYQFGTTLYDSAVTERNQTYQGNVTYHLFEPVGYQHEWIHAAPQLPEYIENFVKIVEDFEKKHAKNETQVTSQPLKQ